MLVILDKDGTLIQPRSGHKFVQAPDDQELLPGVAQRVAELQEQGATLVIASNQGGVAAKHKTLEDAIAEMYYCMSLLPAVKHAFFCPDFEGMELWSCPQIFQVHIKNTSTGAMYPQINEDGSPMMSEAKLISENQLFPYYEMRGTFRKPNAGMLLSAKIWANTDECLMIGDRPEDVAAAEAAGTRFIDAACWRLDGIPVSAR